MIEAVTAQARGVVFHPGLAFNGVKVFSATLMQDRAQLGERITQWLADHDEYRVTEIVVTQSSDSAFHCLAFSVFYRS